MQVDVPVGEKATAASRAEEIFAWVRENWLGELWHLKLASSSTAQPEVSPLQWEPHQKVGRFWRGTRCNTTARLSRLIVFVATALGTYSPLDGGLSK